MNHHNALITIKDVIGAAVVLVLVAGGIGYAAGKMHGALLWKARGDLAQDYLDLAEGWKRATLACQEAHAECKAECPAAPDVNWEKR